MELLKNQKDFFTTLEKAFYEIDADWKNYKGVIIPGSHTPDKIERKLEIIKEARENGIPTLGICFGLQLMAVEFARNVLKIKDATSEEFGKGTFVVSKLLQLRVGIKKVRNFEGKEKYESHWHNYAINNDFVKQFQEKGFLVSLWGEDNIVEGMEIKEHPYYFGVQFHPEYQSTLENPHQTLKSFLLVCKK